MPECWIGIGANIGNATVAFDDAWSRLRQIPEIELQKRSGIYLTHPVGAMAGGTFSNAVFSIQTALPPLRVLDLLQEVEDSLGRTREVRWGPRPIDLDLLFVDQIVLNDPRLMLPHPAAWYRRFVVDPLAEVEPDLVHPLLKQSISQLKRLLERRPFCIGIAGGTLPVEDDHCSEISVKFPSIRICDQTFRTDDMHAYVRLQSEDPPGATREGVPVANLTNSPGSPRQRLIDFCTAVLDQPVRDADW